MTSRLEKFRSSAKFLKKLYISNDRDATKRVHSVFPDIAGAKYSDFLHVIARENGFPSWPKLKHHFELIDLSRDQRAERLKMALYFGQIWIVDELLRTDPTLAGHNLGLQIALYDLKTVASAVSNEPELATRLIGYRTPILHLAFSKYIHMAPDKVEDMLSLADLLLANGANVNDGFAPNPESRHRLSALYGALGHADNMPLAAWLLANGASPDDEESLYHSTELGHRDGLRLLLKHGARTSGTNALARALDFNDLEAIRMLLEHGADPNETVKVHPSGEAVDPIPALHQAARRWCSATVTETLLEFGADPLAVWRGHTPYALARIYGNDDVSWVLSREGFATSLSPIETRLAKCAQGDVGSPLLDPNGLGEEAALLLTRLAARANCLNHIETLVDAGLDPNRSDEMDLTPLHIAGWHGLADHVRYFLTLGPDLTVRNAFGGDALDTVVHGSEFAPKRPESDFIECARLILDAGAVLKREYRDGTGNQDMARFLDDWLNR